MLSWYFIFFNEMRHIFFSEVTRVNDLTDRRLNLHFTSTKVRKEGLALLWRNFLLIQTEDQKN